MERDEKGRWKKGQTGNPKGRPPRKREERYMQILMSACTFKDWRAIVKLAVADAKNENADATTRRYAREWLASYLLGKPLQRHDVEGHIGVSLIPLDWGDEGDMGVASSPKWTIDEDDSGQAAEAASGPA